MSLASHDSQQPSGASSVNSPPRANAKATPAPPKLSGDGNVELQDAPTKLPIEDDVMQLARLGEVGAIQKLFESGRFNAKYKDEEGITPLHWAAINNHYALCNYLVDSGADVNAKGGESVATPAMWAAQRCHYYIVNLLLQHGADPLLTDGQGYNLLHLTTFDGNIYLLLLLLHQNIPVDTPDLQGHTCLMWAAYKGYPACVDLFLRWGASVNATDENGFTALHWALVKGSQGCIQKLLEYGSDRFAQTSTQKTPAVVAEEMRSTRMWYRALAESGYDEDGNLKGPPFPYASFLKQRGFLSKFFFLLPFVELYVIISILSHMVVFAAVPIALFIAYFIQWATQQVLQWAPSDMRHLHRTPFLAGVFAATAFWLGGRWLTTVLPNTYSEHLFLNIVFGISYSFSLYFYIYSMVEDPGYVPKLGSRSQQKAVIDELLGLWKFDDQNFCVICMNRMPVRSKHCKRCGRCIARHDHHCPWINNCVGVNNLRHFFLYILFMEIGILLFVQLDIVYFESLPTPSDTQCNILAESICSIILRDTFTVVLSIWATLQLTWVTMLLVVQLVQISRGQTTYESMHRHSMHHGSRASQAITSALTSGTTTLAGAQLTGNGMGPDPALAPDHGHGHGHGHAHREGWFAQWKKLLGLDTFLATAQGGLKASSDGGPRRQQNPFSRGMVRNCKDFWLDPAPYFGARESGAAMLDGDVVNYTRMYEPPPRMKVRRPRQDAEGALYHSVAADDAV